MAVDTRNKRASVLGYAFAAFVALPLPDASVDAEDRILLSQEYAGLDVNVVSGDAASSITAIGQAAAVAFGPTGAATSAITALGSSATVNVEVGGTAVSAISAIGSAATVAVEVSGTAVSSVSGIGTTAAGIGGEVVEPITPTGRPTTRRGSFTSAQRTGAFSGRTRRGTFT